MIWSDKKIYKKYMADVQGYQMCLEPLSLVNLQYAQTVTTNLEHANRGEASRESTNSKYWLMQW